MAVLVSSMGARGAVTAYRWSYRWVLWADSAAGHKSREEEDEGMRRLCRKGGGGVGYVRLGGSGAEGCSSCRCVERPMLRTWLCRRTGLAGA